MLKYRFNPSKSYRVVVYARMSSDRQNPRSPDQQVQTIKDELRRKGYRWVIVKIYRDDAKSGRTQKGRPGFMSMRQELKSGAIDADFILVDTFERLSRGEDNAIIRSEFAKMGVLVLTANSGFEDPTSVSGQALEFVEALRAREEGRVKAHNVLRGKKDAVRQKQWPGGPVPFGFRLKAIMVVRNGVEEVDFKVLEPDPETSWIVERVFQLATACGWAGTRIAKQINIELEEKRVDIQLTSSSVDHILKNELYCGEMVWGKNCTGIVDEIRVRQANPEDEWLRIPDYCPAIVSQEVWQQAEDLRMARSKKMRETRPLSTKDEVDSPVVRASSIALKYPLSGLVICQSCGRSMVASSSPLYTTVTGEERRYVSYVCPGHRTGICENQTSIPEDWLRETVFNLIRSRLFPSDNTAN